jgi:predicted dehydrogenase (TIGR03970 family)
VVVVGGGSAGAVIAARLSEDPGRSVLLLEAGQDYPDLDALPDGIHYGGMRRKPADRAPANPAPVPGTRWELSARFAPNDAAPRTTFAGRIMGGSSAVNLAFFVRGVPEDYDLWASQGNDRWSFDQLLPFFKRIEADADFPESEYHGRDGPIAVGRVARPDWGPWQEAFRDAVLDAGFAEAPDHNDPWSTGLSPVPANTDGGVRVSTAIGYLQPARHRPNLNLKGGCRVRRVCFDGRRATGVEVESRGETFVVEADMVVLSAGAFFSPQLLMLSGVGPADHLRALDIPVVADLPGVGENLRDHPHTFVSWTAGREAAAAPEPVAALPVVLRYTAAGSDLRNDLKLSVQRDGPGRSPVVAGPTLALKCGLYFEQSAGSLRLTSADPHVQPSIDYRYLTDATDRAKMREMLRTALTLGAHPAFKGLVGDLLEPTAAQLDSDAALDAWMQTQAMTTYHASGTCKMGPASDPRAVVDQFGCVHGVAGLRVADASIMPHAVRANTNATCLAIGERVADLIRSGR